MTETTIPQIKHNNTVIEEPAMVMGFLPAALHAKLRRMAAEEGCSESMLVSRFVREALVKTKRAVRRELQ